MAPVFTRMLISAWTNGEPASWYAMRFGLPETDDAEGYDLTELGKQFVHYAMTELPPKIEFSDESLESEK